MVLSLMLGLSFRKTEPYKIIYTNKIMYSNEGERKTCAVFYKTSKDTVLHGRTVSEDTMNSIVIGKEYVQTPNNGESYAMMVVGFLISLFLIATSWNPLKEE